MTFISFLRRNDETLTDKKEINFEINKNFPLSLSVKLNKDMYLCNVIITNS